MKFKKGFHKTSFTAAPGIVNNRSQGIIYDPPSRLRHTLAPVRILPIHEKPVIHWADLVDCFSPDKHKSAGDPVHIERPVVNRGSG